MAFAALEGYITLPKVVLRFRGFVFVVKHWLVRSINSVVRGNVKDVSQKCTTPK